MITDAEYIEIIKQASVTPTSLRAAIQPDNVSNTGPISAPTTADDAVRQAKTLIPKSASLLDRQLDALRTLMVKSAITKTALVGLPTAFNTQLGKMTTVGGGVLPKPNAAGAVTAKGIAGSLNPGKGMNNLGGGLNKNLSKSMSVNVPKPTTVMKGSLPQPATAPGTPSKSPALKPNKSVNSTADVTVTAPGGFKMKSGVSNAISSRSPATSGTSPKAK